MITDKLATLFLFALLYLLIGASHEASKCESSWVRSFVARHNTLRERHCVSELSINSTIGSYAQEWADHLLEEGKLDHRDQSQYGENLFSNFDPNASVLGGTVPVMSWYDEIDKYEQYFGKEPDMSGLDDWGHFTQLVWKGTDQIGVGCAISEDDKTTYIVSNYAPPGNIVGQFKDNVLKEHS